TTRHRILIRVPYLSHPTRRVVTGRRESRPSFFPSPFSSLSSDRVPPPPAAARHAWPTADAVAAGAHRPPSFSFLPSHFSFSLFLFLFPISFPPFLFFFFFFLFSFLFSPSFLPPLPRPRSWPLPRTPHRPAPLGLPPNARARSQPVHHPCP